jgi:F-type H+-transporting ATPase subunit delta
MPTPATVPGVYAEALLALAAERGSRAAVVEACRDLATGLTPAALAPLDDPRLGKQKAKAVVQQSLAQAPREVVDLLCLLIDRNRLPEAPGILREAVRRAEAADGSIRVRVVSARPLAPALADAIARAIGPGAQVVAAHDPALLGGITIRIGDRLVDGSVRRQLAEMKHRMLNAPVSDALWVKE